MEGGWGNELQRGEQQGTDAVKGNAGLMVTGYLTWEGGSRTTQKEMERQGINNTKMFEKSQGTVLFCIYLKLHCTCTYKLL